MMSTSTSKQQQIKVRYNETNAQFASQFILNSSEEDIIINFSSGPLTDPSTNETILPIHTRIGMTVEAAKRLQNVLSQVLSAPAQPDTPDQAKLPKMQ